MDKSRAFGSGSGSATYEYHPLQKGNPWQPGFFRGAPWTGLGALLGALLSLTAGVLILEFSNNQPIADWMVQPTVYLAIASAAANVFLHFALSEAATIAWWYNSMKPRATLGSLHRNWTFNQSLLAALTSGRNFNIIALSSILVALVPINGPLFQRASHIAYKDFQQDIIVDIAIAEVIPDAYTGYLSNRAHEPTLLTPAFSRVLSNFNQRSPIPLVNNSCKGHCNATVAGAGFVTNCSQSTHPFILDPDLVQDRDQSMQIAINGTDVFGSYMLWPLEAVAALDIEQDMDNWPYEIAGSFNFGLQFKNTTACQGNLVVRNCSFKPATVLYPITIDGNASTISLAAGTNISDDKVLKVVDGISAFEGNNNAASGLNASTYSGFFKALADSYQSVSHMSFGAIGYQIFVAGPLANRYLNITHDLNCDLNFRDPMDDVVADIRELMFRTALASANLTSVPTDLHHVPAHDTFNIPVWSSSNLFLWLAVLVSLLGWIATAPVFFGWWHLGRTVSMSPIEIARAFEAPALQTQASNSDAKMLLVHSGQQAIQYGVSTSTAMTDPHLENVQERSGRRLLMNRPEWVRRPEAGEILDG